MKHIKKLKFAQILRNKPIGNNLINIFKKAFSRNLSIFKKSPKKFNIIICDNENDFKREAKYYYQKWATATVLRNNNLVAKSPEFVDRIGRWEQKDYQGLINHEMSHIFWQDFYHSSKPVWLSEGLACHIGNNFISTKNQLELIIKKYKVNLAILEYRYIKRNFKNGHLPRYPVWANFVKYLINKNSVGKIIKLMDNYSKHPTKPNYYKMFKNIFRKTDKQLFEEFLENVCY